MKKYDPDDYRGLSRSAVEPVPEQEDPGDLDERWAERALLKQPEFPTVPPPLPLPVEEPPKKKRLPYRYDAVTETVEWIGYGEDL